MSNIVTDPTYVPSATILKVVNLTVGKVDTDAKVQALFKSNVAQASGLEAQDAVLVRIMHQRGHATDVIATWCGKSTDTVKRYIVEGMAIMATQEITRTVAAVRGANSSAGYLGVKAVEQATAGLSDSESKIAALELAAVTKHIKAVFVTEDAKVPSTDLVRDVEEAARKAVVDSGQTENVGSINAMIPHLSESLGLTRKTRTSDPNGDGGAQLLSVHIKRALTDMRAIAATGSAYELTTDDLKQLLNLLNYIGMDDLMPLVKEHSSINAEW